MAQSFTYDGSALSSVIRSTVSLTEKADHGEVGEGRLTLDDDAGTLTIVGHKSFLAEQSSCSVARTFTGYVGGRTFGRGERQMVAAGREIQVSLLDLNARLGFKVIRARSWNRPAETVGERMTALLASTYLSSLVADLGFVTYPTDPMDKNDYRTQFPLDVIRDCALVVGFNYFVYYDATADDYGLWFADSNASTDFSSTLKISNGSDIDSSTIFAASQDTALSRDPAEVISGVLVPFAKGNVYRTRAATETNYEPRDGVAPNSQVKKRAKAVTLGDRYLFERRNEEDSITTTVRLRASQVNLIRAGQRVQAKFTHFATEGYGEYSWFRILERTVTHPLNTDNDYDLALTLSPQEETCSVSIVQAKEVDSVGNVDITLDANPTIGNLLIAIGVRTGNSSAFMNSGQGWTEITQVNIDDCCGNPGSAGYAFAFYKVVDSTTPIWSRGTEAGQYQWRLYELSGADPADISFVSVDNDATHVGQTSASLDSGDLTSANGVAIMCEIVGRGTDQSATAGAFSMGGWTERFDNQFDPTVGDPIPSPWVGIGDQIGTGSTIDCAWTYTESGQGNPDQSIGNWAGIALLVGAGC